MKDKEVERIGCVYVVIPNSLIFTFDKVVATDEKGNGSVYVASFKGNFNKFFSIILDLFMFRINMNRVEEAFKTFPETKLPDVISEGRKSHERLGKIVYDFNNSETKTLIPAATWNQLVKELKFICEMDSI